MVSVAVINRSAAWSISSKSTLLHPYFSSNEDIVESSNLELVSKNNNKPCSLHSLAKSRAITVLLLPQKPQPVEFGCDALSL